MKKKNIKKVLKICRAEFQSAINRNKELEHELFDAEQLIKNQAEEIEFLKEKINSAHASAKSCESCRYKQFGAKKCRECVDYGNKEIIQ